MKLEKKDIITLAKQVVKADRKAPIAYRFDDKDYSFEALNETLREQFQELAKDFNSYRRNKNDIFEIMQEVVDEVLPRKINEAYGQFAEVRTYNQGNKPQFVKRTGKTRAKQFVTKVGLAGIYEVFKLDTQSFDIDITAYGGAAQIGLEEFLDGVIDFATLTDIIMEGLNDAVFVEIATALTALVDNTALPAANTVKNAGSFSGTDFDELINVVRAYGTPVIYTSFAFASTNLLTADGWTSETVKDELYNQGYLGKYKGVRVVVLPQTFTDETNATKVLTEKQAYILPVTETEKPVKVAIEGQTIIDEFVNKDRSREIQVFKKFGVGIIANNDICIYELS